MVICERFHLSPFEVRRERFTDFLLLVERFARHNQIERRKYMKVNGQYIKKQYASDNETI